MDSSSICTDVDRSYDSFIRQSNENYHKFKFQDVSNQHCMFTSNCMLFLGTDVLHDKLEKHK